MHKTNKILTVILIAAIVLTMAAPVAASSYKEAKLYYNNIKITLDGDELRPTTASGTYVEPFIIDGTTYLPVRGISSALGLNVDWDGSTSTVILTTPEDHSSVYITRTGSKYHYDSHCNGGTYWPVPFDTAVGMGLKPCEKCVHD